MFKLCDNLSELTNPSELMDHPGPRSRSEETNSERLSRLKQELNQISSECHDTIDAYLAANVLSVYVLLAVRSHKKLTLKAEPDGVCYQFAQRRGVICSLHLASNLRLFGGAIDAIHAI